MKFTEAFTNWQTLLKANSTVDGIHIGVWQGVDGYGYLSNEQYKEELIKAEALVNSFFPQDEEQDKDSSNHAEKIVVNDSGDWTYKKKSDGDEEDV